MTLLYNVRVREYTDKTIYPKQTQLAAVEWKQVAQNIQCCKHGNVPSRFITNTGDILTNRVSSNTFLSHALLISE
jgi:hypothetical protein